LRLLHQKLKRLVKKKHHVPLELLNVKHSYEEMKAHFSPAIVGRKSDLSVTLLIHVEV
jgi:hypothetical protein